MLQDSMLKCPRCNEMYLHQQEVRAVWRDEDEDGVMHTSALRKKGEQVISKSQCVGRRDWLEIDFSCEYCPDIYTLIMAQHKGNTFLEWKK